MVDPATGRIRRRGDGSPVTRQVHRSTKKAKNEKQAAAELLKRWEGEAARLLALTPEEEVDRVLVRRAAAVEQEREREEQARRAFTLADLRDLWLRQAAPKKSIADDRTRFAVILELLGAERPIAELTSADVLALRDTLLARPTARGSLHTRATVNRYLALLKAALRAAEDHGHEHARPMRGVQLLREDNKRDRICSRAEYARLIAAARPELRLAIVLAYHTGMRRGDIAALAWGAIDLREKLIRVRSESEKTGHGRTIPIVDEVARELENIEPKERSHTRRVPSPGRRTQLAACRAGLPYNRLPRKMYTLPASWPPPSLRGAPIPYRRGVRDHGEPADRAHEGVASEKGDRTPTPRQAHYALSLRGRAGARRYGRSGTCPGSCRGLGGRPGRTSRRRRRRASARATLGRGSRDRAWGDRQC